MYLTSKLRLYWLQPEKPDDATIEAWYMDDSDEDQRLPHKCVKLLARRQM